MAKRNTKSKIERDNEFILSLGSNALLDFSDDDIQDAIEDGINRATKSEYQCKLISKRNSKNHTTTMEIKLIWLEGWTEPSRKG